MHRELVAAQAAGGVPAPSFATLHRAVRRDLPPGDLAGLRSGELARRDYDVFLKRPVSYRNETWEGDHVEAPVEVVVEGRLLRPWVTWFIDVGTNAVTGAAVTAGPASRESILATLRAAICLQAPYGPPGGLPGRVRIDRGQGLPVAHRGRRAGGPGGAGGGPARVHPAPEGLGRDAEPCP